MLLDYIESLVPIAGLLILFGIAALVFKKTSAPANELLEIPYKKEDMLFSPAERSFLGVLEQAVGEDYRVMGKVRLADIFRVRKGISRKNWQKAFNRIQSKHVDFVVCKKGDFSIQCLIELDDKSHSKPKSIQKDKFLNDISESSGLPLIRMPARQTYTVHEISSAINSHLCSGIEDDHFATSLNKAI